MSTMLLSSPMATPLMRAICADGAKLQRMLDFEAALAAAEAACGVVPMSAVSPIAAACRAELYDARSLAAQSADTGNVAIPLVKALTAAVARTDPDAAGYVHWGATSQDVIDTATMLEMRAAANALLTDLDRAVAGFAAQARTHRSTLMAGRTWLQHALPIPFGLKLAGYATALARSRQRLMRLKREALALQFGGAAGTLAALGDKGLAVATVLSERLGLPLPPAPWHNHRDVIADWASALAILAGSCGKIGRDIALLMQTEVGEAFEPRAAGRGGSSSMPHKRNPVASAIAIAAATAAPGLAATIFSAQMQDHERGAGPWQAEWAALPELALTVSGALAAVADIAEGLQTDAARMADNLGLTQGLVMAEAVAMALAPVTGKARAHALVEDASRVAAIEKRPLREVLESTPAIASHLSSADLDRLFDPQSNQGVASELIDRMLDSLNDATP